MDERPLGNGPTGDSAVEAAFSLLADETRLSILRELYEADQPLSFSTLRERVGVRDSGQFNYHLGKLTDQFVDHGESGYELNNAGVRILGAVFAGSYDGDVTIEPVPIDDPCPLCDGSLQAVYDRDHFEITCRDCETHLVGYPAPPGILRGRERSELPDVFSRYARRVLEQIADGFCPFCLGPTEPELGADAPVGVGIIYTCRHCGVEMTMDASISLLGDPEATTFLREHGLAIDEAPLWNLGPLFDAEERVIEDVSDPAAIAFAVESDGRTLTIRLDDEFSVLETRQD
mgnify:CR=1 FL=1